MYQSWKDSLNLQDILEKLAAQKAGLPTPTPTPAIITATTYAKSDISRASKVLARLQRLEAGREVAYITHPVKECSERQ